MLPDHQDVLEIGPGKGAISEILQTNLIKLAELDGDLLEKLVTLGG